MVLDFTDDLGKRHFEFVFVGFCLGGSRQDKKGMQVLRMEVGFFEKLESISELKPCGKKLINGEPERQLKNGKTEGEGPASVLQIQISLPEYDMLHNYASQVPWQAGSPAKHAVEMIDWLERTERESRK